MTLEEQSQREEVQKLERITERDNQSPTEIIVFQRETATTKKRSRIKGG